MVDCFVSSFRINHRNNQHFDICLQPNSPIIFHLVFVKGTYTIVKEVIKSFQIIMPSVHWMVCQKYRYQWRKSLYQKTVKLLLQHLFKPGLKFYLQLKVSIAVWHLSQTRWSCHKVLMKTCRSDIVTSDFHPQSRDERNVLTLQNQQGKSRGSVQKVWILPPPTPIRPVDFFSCLSDIKILATLV